VRTDGNDDELIKAAQINCAISNPLEVIIAQTEEGRGILGVIDGEKPKGIESAKNKEERISFLCTICYKRSWQKII
ncbi:MAG TPA: adenosine-specific kinase, partial [Candidatus Methanoperedens sp.]